MNKIIGLKDDESVEISVKLRPDPASRLRSMVALAHARADELWSDDRLQDALARELDALLGQCAIERGFVVSRRS